MPESNNDLLAILGGTPAAEKPFEFNNSISDEEKTAVLRVIENGELSGFIASPGEPFWGGQEVRGLQEEFQTRFSIKHAIAFNSATSALHAAVAATGIGPGDEVITSPYTMSATATAILMTGAVPIFADIEDTTFGIDPASVEACLSGNTKGILAVNIFGHAAQLDRLREVAANNDLFLLEDNAQAPGALFKGQSTGTIGDAGIFSFNRHKVMQCGEGGVLVTDDDKIAQKAALVRNHGESVVAAMEIDDIVNTVGLNYRMTEMEAAVAREQFRKMDGLNKQRIALANRLTAGLSNIEGLTPPLVNAESTHVYYMYAIRYNEDEIRLPRNLFAQAIEAEGFFLRPGYVKPLYLEPLYQRKICFGPNGFPFIANDRNAEISYAEGICPTCERLQNNELMITPIAQPPQTAQDMDLFVQACKKVIRNKDDLLAGASNLAL